MMIKGELSTFVKSNRNIKFNGAGSKIGKTEEIYIKR